MTNESAHTGNPIIHNPAPVTLTPGETSLFWIDTDGAMVRITDANPAPAGAAVLSVALHPETPAYPSRQDYEERIRDREVTICDQVAKIRELRARIEDLRIANVDLVEVINKLEKANEELEKARSKDEVEFPRPLRSKFLSCSAASAATRMRKLCEDTTNVCMVADDGTCMRPMTEDVLRVLDKAEAAEGIQAQLDTYKAFARDLWQRASDVLNGYTD